MSGWFTTGESLPVQNPPIRYTTFQNALDEMWKPLPNGWQREYRGGWLKEKDRKDHAERTGVINTVRQRQESGFSGFAELGDPKLFVRIVRFITVVVVELPDGSAATF